MKKEINLTTPLCWEELTPDQVVFVAKQYTLDTSKEEILIRCFLTFTGCKLRKRYPSKNTDGTDVFDLKHKRIKFQLSAEDLMSFCEQLNYLIDEVGLMPCPGNVGKFNCPDNRLYNHTLEEYLAADAYYLQYSQTNKTGLDELIAVLYRRKNEPYCDKGFEKRLPKIRKADKYVKAGVYLWFTGFKKWIIQKYPFVFGKPEEVNDTPHDEIIFGLLESVNDGKPHDNERILKTHVHEVLYSLNNKIEQLNKLKNK